MIKHEPSFNTDNVCEIYSEGDGVEVTYVCTSALGNEAQAMDIFYRETPHPEFGNRYFGLYNNRDDCLMIANADTIEGQVFSMIEDDSGALHYSAHRHDYKVVDDKMIDGGRAYTKSNTKTIPYRVQDGNLVPITDEAE